MTFASIHAHHTTLGKRTSKSFTTKNVPFIGLDFLFRHFNFTTIISQETLLPYHGFETYEYYYWDLYFACLGLAGTRFCIFGGWPVPHTYTLSAILDYMACLVFAGEWIGSCSSLRHFGFFGFGYTLFLHAACSFVTSRYEAGTHT